MSPKMQNTPATEPLSFTEVLEHLASGKPIWDTADWPRLMVQHPGKTREEVIEIWKETAAIIRTSALNFLKNPRDSPSDRSEASLNTLSEMFEAATHAMGMDGGSNGNTHKLRVTKAKKKKKKKKKPKAAKTGSGYASGSALGCAVPALTENNEVSEAHEANRKEHGYPRSRGKPEETYLNEGLELLNIAWHLEDNWNGMKFDLHH